ncbi:hypothetical protein [Kitasatospora sp. NPDC059827]|uniref:hypothetical protein n=1 Tax=unclassified Kitasatospora TaxID=2633591 RepID=UPI003651BD15
MSPDHAEVAQWDRATGHRAAIGGPADRLFTGPAGLFATDPGNDHVTRYSGSPGSWTPIGETAAETAVT